MADIRVKDLTEASVPGADYYLLTDSATDGVKKVKTTNVVIPVATGISGLGTGVATFLATPSSANLASALTDETGSGAAVFATSPTLVTPTLGVAAATSINKVAVTAPATGATLTIADGKTLTAPDNATVSGTNTGDQTITLTGDVTGTGTGSFAATIGATKVTSAMLNADVFSTAHTWGGQQTFVAPVLGTPASGVATNLTGTASGLTAGNVTTNANMTGDVTSVGNATTIGATKVTSAMLNADVFSTAHSWGGVQTFTNPVVGTQTAGDNSTKAASTAFVQAAVSASVSGVASIGGETGALVIPFGQARLTKSGSNIVLSPYGGNIITINGASKRIPTAGVSLAPTGLTVGTVYYIYAYMNAGTMTLEASTTGHSTSTTAGNEGVEIKTGDDTRTLVGMVRIDTGTVFTDTATNRYVRSWFNDGGVESINYFTANRSITSTAAIEIHSEIRVYVVLWSGEHWLLDATSPVRNSAASGQNSLGIDLDGATTFSGGTAFASLTTANDTTTINAQNTLSGGSEGLHSATLVGSVASGTGLYFGDTTARRTSLRGFTRR